VLQDPPRVYLDFLNVSMGDVPVRVASTAAPVLRVRVGSHSTPLSTRVVIDLSAAQPHRFEMDGGSVKVVIGRTDAAAPAAAASTVPIAAPPAVRLPPSPPPVGLTGTWTDIPRVPSLPASPAEPAASPGSPLTSPPALPPAPPLRPAPSYAPIGPTPPQPDIERYRKQAWGSLDRLRLQQPLLIALDIGQSETAERVQMAVAEFERITQDLKTIKAPDTMALYHAMLVQASSLALQAFSLRLDAFRTGDANTTRNASSAAAGAVMLLDRACSVVNCPPIPGR
jgi:hypothetical protein